MPVSVADFGTRLVTLWWPAEDGSVKVFALDYAGNPVALSRVAARWREVFRAAGVDCEGRRSCEWSEGGKVIASLYVERRWLVPTYVAVDVDLRQ